MTSMARPTSRIALVVLVACALAALAATALVRPSPAAAAGPPAVSGLVSPTHPVSSAWYANSDPSFSWRGVSATPPVAGYSYVLDQDPITEPDTVADLAAFSFAPKRDAAISRYPTALAVADFDRDGKLDLAVLNSDAGSVTILFGKGNGAFGRRRLTRVTKGSDSIAVADLNRDGKPDLVIDREGTVSVLLGNGNGSFRATHSYRVGTFSGTLAIADVNRDHHPDIVASFRDMVKVLLGNGNGTFGAAHSSVVDANGSVYSLAFGDLNGDGRTDLVAGSVEGANQLVGALSVLLGKGDGSFKAAVTHTTGELIPQKLAVTDVNRDGKADLLVGDYADGVDYGDPAYCAVDVCLGKGTGSFSPAVQYVVGPQGQFGPSGFKVADVNRDGEADLLVTTGAGLYVLLGNGDGSFQPAAAFGTMSRPGGPAAVGDFNHDGKPDLAVAGGFGNTVSVFLNRSNAASYHGLADGVWYFHVRAVDTSAVGGLTAARVVRIDTQRPSTQAPNAASVKTGAIAYLTFEVNDPSPSAGWCTVHIVVKNGHGVVLHRHTSGHAHSGVLYQTGFRCGFAKGTYRFYVYATDAAGNTQGNVAWDRLVVK